MLTHDRKTWIKIVLLLVTLTVTGLAVNAFFVLQGHIQQIDAALEKAVRIELGHHTQTVAEAMNHGQRAAALMGASDEMQNILNGFNYEKEDQTAAAMSLLEPKEETVVVPDEEPEVSEFAKKLLQSHDLMAADFYQNYSRSFMERFPVISAIRYYNDEAIPTFSAQKEDVDFEFELNPEMVRELEKETRYIGSGKSYVGLPKAQNDRVLVPVTSPVHDAGTNSYRGFVLITLDLTKILTWTTEDLRQPLAKRFLISNDGFLLEMTHDETSWTFSEKAWKRFSQDLPDILVFKKIFVASKYEHLDHLVFSESVFSHNDVEWRLIYPHELSLLRVDRSAEAQIVLLICFSVFVSMGLLVLLISHVDKNQSSPKKQSRASSHAESSSAKVPAPAKQEKAGVAHYSHVEGHAVLDKKSASVSKKMDRADPGIVAKIMVVDDDPDINEVLYRFLSNAGYQARVFTSPMAALETLKDEDYFLVISDYHMPVMNGLKFNGEIRKVRPDLPFVFYTAHGHFIEKLLDKVNADIDVIIDKPADQDQILTVVDSFAEIRRMRSTG